MVVQLRHELYRWDHLSRSDIRRLVSAPYWIFDQHSRTCGDIQADPARHPTRSGFRPLRRRLLPTLLAALAHAERRVDVSPKEPAVSLITNIHLIHSGRQDECLTNLAALRRRPVESVDVQVNSSSSNIKHRMK